MTPKEIQDFIEKAITTEGSTWADLGAGNGKMQVVRERVQQNGKERLTCNFI